MTADSPVDYSLHLFRVHGSFLLNAGNDWALSRLLISDDVGFYIISSPV